MQGLEGAALRLDRLPGPLGFNLLNQLILDPVRGQRSQELKDKRKSSSKKGPSIVVTESKEKLKREKKEKMMWEGEEGEKRARKGRESVSEQRRGGEGGQMQAHCHCQSVHI